mmetsp:Transcript_7859/g.25165  ORF Transcript_7859/g.25165 Transcript_7859/m.25165 type:complete len:284 (+) Transcript_7859:624-1475(+)
MATRRSMSPGELMIALIRYMKPSLRSIVVAFFSCRTKPSNRFFSFFTVLKWVIACSRMRWPSGGIMHVTVSSFSTTPLTCGDMPCESSASVRFFTAESDVNTARRPTSLFMIMRRHRMHSASTFSSVSDSCGRRLDALDPSGKVDSVRFSISPRMDDSTSSPSRPTKRCSHESGWHESRTRSSLSVFRVPSALSLPTQYSGLSSTRPLALADAAASCCFTMFHFISSDMSYMALRCSSVGNARFRTTSSNFCSSSSIGMGILNLAAFRCNVGTMPKLFAVSAR